MKDRLSYNIFKVLYNSYSLKQRIGFIFNTLQSTFSELFFGLLYWYVFDRLYDNGGNYILAIILLFVVAVYFIFLVPLWGFWMESGQSKAKELLSNSLFSKLFKCRPSYVNSIHSSRILNSFQEDIPKVVELGGWETVVLFQAIISGVVSAFSFLLIKWQLLVLLLIVGMFPLLIDYIYSRKNKLLLSDLRECSDKRLELLADALDNYTVIKIYNASANKIEKFNSLTDQMIAKQVKVNFNNNIITFIHGFIYNTVFRIVILVGGVLWLSAGEITMGEIAFLFSMSEGIGFFLDDIGSYVRNVQSVMVSKNKLEKFFDDASKNEESREPYFEKIKRLSLRNLCFKYPEVNNYLLNSVNFEFEIGKKYLIHGENGAGKSTLMKILMKIYEPERGEVLANGVPYKYGNNQIAYVPQEPKLFSGTLKDNLIADNFSELEKVREILNVVGLEDFTLDYEILENGENLSKGQKERIVLARALVRCPDVLIMDEADANLDNLTFNQIITNIQRKYKDSCIIAITHSIKQKEYNDFIHVTISNGSLVLRKV